jgi:crotonobetainyl-CoA:carnitine CoA-transferase CaiB-like acyl-CoA transferase
MMKERDEAREALEDLKVVDFGWAIAAPVICWYLATHGATVVRVETSTRPDVYRVSAPYKDNKPGLNRAGFFAYPNVNKLSIALNMNLPQGIELAKKLGAWADVVVDNFRVGPMEKWGLGYEDLKKVKPDIIMVRTTNQGLTGPHNTHPGWGWQLVGLSGISNLAGWPDLEPLSFGMPYTDVIAPRFGVAALMAALIHRKKTGKGQLIDLSQLETALQFISPAMLNYFANQENDKRTGNASPYAAPHRVYRCKGQDRWCAITVLTETEWKDFCHVIGRPQLSEDRKFATLSDRKKNEEELNQIVEAWTVQFPPEEVADRMQAARVPCGIVQNAQDVFGDEQLRQRNYFWTLDHTEMGPYAHMGQPFGLSETPARPRMPAPCLGEHNEYVCTKLLGMPDEEFLELLTLGLFE